MTHRSPRDGTDQTANVVRLDAATALITEVRASLAGTAPPIPPTGPAVSTPEAFDAALAAAPPGGVVTCATTLVYTKTLTLLKPVQIVSERLVDGVWRMTRDEPAPQFLGGIRVPADDVTLAGLEVRHPDPGVAIVELTALRPRLDRLRILGDPDNGSKRGIGANGGAMTITRCYIDDIKRKGQDSQAILGTEFLAPGLLIDDCWLSAAGMSVMLGGDDGPSEATIPRGVALLHSDCTKQAAWLTEGWQIKCAIECKNVIGMLVRDSTAQYAGTSEGQGGFLFVLTPRNQYGNAPWSTVEHVLVENVHARYGCGCVSFTGHDDNYPSGTLTHITFRNVCFDEIDRYGPCKGDADAGIGRMFQFQHGPVGVTLEAITVIGANMKSDCYFIGTAPTGLVIRNQQWAEVDYHLKIDGGGQGEDALRAYAPDVVYDVTPEDEGAGEVPALPDD